MCNKSFQECDMTGGKMIELKDLIINWAPLKRERMK